MSQFSGQFRTPAIPGRFNDNYHQGFHPPGGNHHNDSSDHPPHHPMPAPTPMVDKTLRSIFVGNIPYEATEEKLIELFGKAGPVVSFRLVFDRESGKPKGYGFCEYSDVTVANSALRNLQNIEFNGRPLRIGPAAGDQNQPSGGGGGGYGGSYGGGGSFGGSAAAGVSNASGDFQGGGAGGSLAGTATGGGTACLVPESPYGDPVQPKDAPEAISRAVASLPPEQMFDLMVQMKQCVQRNPHEARLMLLQNPQLAYALLQAQIVMKVVEPKAAIALLNRSNEAVAPLVLPANAGAQPASSLSLSVTPSAGGKLTSMPSGEVSMDLGPGESVLSVGAARSGPTVPAAMNYQYAQSGNPAMVGQQRVGQPPPSMPLPGPGGMMNSGPPMFGYSSSGTGMPVLSVAAAAQPMGPGPGLRPGHSAGTSVGGPPTVGSVSANNPAMMLPSADEQAKTALVMKVLELSDQQIAMLPEDQRRSIMILKEQIATGGSLN